MRVRVAVGRGGRTGLKRKGMWACGCACACACGGGEGGRGCSERCAAVCTTWVCHDESGPEGRAACLPACLLGRPSASILPSSHQRHHPHPRPRSCGAALLPSSPESPLTACALLAAPCAPTPTPRPRASSGPAAVPPGAPHPQQRAVPGGLRRPHSGAYGAQAHACACACACMCSTAGPARCRRLSAQKTLLESAQLRSHTHSAPPASTDRHMRRPLPNTHNTTNDTCTCKPPSTPAPTPAPQPAHTHTWAAGVGPDAPLPGPGDARLGGAAAPWPLPAVPGGPPAWRAAAGAAAAAPC